MKVQTLCCIALLLLVTLPSAGTRAQDAPEPSEGDTGRPETKTEEQRSGPEDATTSTPYEPFVPSESISGDSSVAFPVDI